MSSADIDTLIVSLQEFFKNFGFENNQQMTEKHEKLPRMQSLSTCLIVLSKLSGRVLEWRPRGSGFKIHQRHSVVSLSKTHLSLLSTGSTQEDLSRHNWKIVD